MTRNRLQAIVAGAMIPFAFAPFHLFPLAPLGVAWLFWLWRHASPRKALGIGWWFGLGMFGFGISWVAVSIARYGGVGWGLASFLTMLLVAVLALYPAFLGYTVQRLYPQEGRVKYLLVLPAAWVLVEWLRGWLFTGFPWLALGYSQIDTPLGGIVPLLGVYGLSWLTALTAGILLLWLRSRRHVFGFFLILLWAGAWPLGHIAWTSPKGEALPVSLIQGNIEQGIKWDPKALPSTLERYLAFTFEAMRRGSRLIIWPETALPLFYHQAQDMLERLGEDAKRQGASLLIGLPFKEGDRYYNTLVGIGGQTVFYHKRHLVPFGEYIPLKGLIGHTLALLSIPMSDFSPGPSSSPLPLAGTLLGASICYEIAFPRVIRSSLPEAEILVNVSNDAWFGHSLAPYQHLQMARMRAKESGRELLRATNTGLTAIIDSQGKIKKALPPWQAGWLEGEAQPYEGATPYVLMGDIPLLGLLALLAFVPAIFRAREATRCAAPGVPKRSLTS